MKIIYRDRNGDKHEISRVASLEVENDTYVEEMVRVHCVDADPAENISLSVFWGGGRETMGLQVLVGDDDDLDSLQDVNIGEFSKDGFGKLSDGDHTFNDLYTHRIRLWIAVCRLASQLRDDGISSSARIYRSWKHDDGTCYDGWFVLGMLVGADDHMITYHLPEEYWDECDFAQTMDQTPPFDGHTAETVVRRLKGIEVVGDGELHRYADEVADGD